MQRPQQEPTSPYNLRSSFDLVMFTATILSMCILPLTRRRMGRRCMGRHGFFAMLLIFFYAGLQNSIDMFHYLYVWIGMVIFRRLTADKQQHTRYPGSVWLFDWCI